MLRFNRLSQILITHVGKESQPGLYAIYASCGQRRKQSSLWFSTSADVKDKSSVVSPDATSEVLSSSSRIEQQVFGVSSEQAQHTSGSIGSDTTAVGAVPEADTGLSGNMTAEKESIFPKIIVFGGRGFVGSAICKQAVKTGVQVVSISPSGTPPPVKESWVEQVDWLRGNLLEPQSYADYLKDSLAAISCVGGFGTQSHMLKVNGEANVAAIRVAKHAGVPRFVYISAFIPAVPGLEYALSGYIQGKRSAERVLFEEYPETGIALQPSIISGSRVVSQHISLPLHLLFGPAQHVLNTYLPVRQLTQLPYIGGLFMPPVSLENVAKCAVDAATDSSIPGGTMDVWQIQSRTSS